MYKTMKMIKIRTSDVYFGIGVFPYFLSYLALQNFCRELPTKYDKILSATSWVKCIELLLQTDLFPRLINYQHKSHLSNKTILHAMISRFVWTIMV